MCVCVCVCLCACVRACACMYEERYSEAAFADINWTLKASKRELTCTVITNTVKCTISLVAKPGGVQRISDHFQAESSRTHYRGEERGTNWKWWQGRAVEEERKEWLKLL